MLALLVAAAITWRMYPLDDAWSRLAAAATTHDAQAFAADRSEIARLDDATLTGWGATRRESYQGPRYSVTTYAGPTHVRGDRGRAAYFAVLVPEADFKQPTLWEVTPGFSPPGVTYWLASVYGCRLDTGDPVGGHPKTWTRPAGAGAPGYDEFKAFVAATTKGGREFPDNTTVAHSPGTTCLYVGNLPVEHLLPPPR